MFTCHPNAVRTKADLRCLKKKGNYVTVTLLLPILGNNFGTCRFVQRTGGAPVMWELANPASNNILPGGCVLGTCQLPDTSQFGKHGAGALQMLQVSILRIVSSNVFFRDISV
jgi:hypothetical protein